MNKYISLLTLMLLSISAAYSSENLIPINTGHKEITNKLINKLNEENVWYHQKNETIVIVNWPISQSIKSLLENESEKIIPKSHSMSVAEEHRNELYLQLQKHNISYKKVIYDNKEFIVWNKKRTKEVQSLLDTVSQ